VADVEVRIGGRKYELTCRDGDEDRLRQLAGMVDGKVAEAARGMGGLNEVRQLLFAALLLADQLSEELAKAAAAPPPQPESSEPALDEVAILVIEELAARVETLAARLENDGARA
jgi:cell division protein ZapA